MEKIETDTQTPETEVTETTSTPGTETLEANEPDHGTTDSQGESTSEPRSLNDQLAELGISREDYFRLKGKEDGEEGGSKVEENSQQVASTDDALLGRLEARGVMDVDDQDYVIKAAKSLGVSPIEALNDDVVKDRLAANQKARETTDATPSSSSRSGQTSPTDTVDHWLKKGELPPKEKKDLRRKVMHAMNDSRRRSQMFNN